jgi:histidine ammonia-lyase/phenylalanine ammonia-lyase
MSGREPTSTTSRTQAKPSLTVELDGASLTIADALSVARGARSVSLSPRALGAVDASCELKRSLIDKEVPIYGVTTGFGDSANRQIATAKTEQLQRSLLRMLGCGTGPLASAEVTRVTMLLRANCLAKGNSGVRRELIERLLLFLNENALPLIPERGSCGASGDLVPLSYVGRALAGEADSEHCGEVKSGSALLEGLQLEPIRLEAKEGLAITNGTSFTTAFACLAVAATWELADLSDLLTAMASEALRGNRGHFNEFIFQVKPSTARSCSLADSTRTRSSSWTGKSRTSTPSVVPRT